MNLNKVFRPFKIKLLFENILNAFTLATMSSFFAIFLASLIYHILVKETPLVSTCMIGGIVFAVAFCIRFVLAYPTKKRVAARLDAMGLQERASTMLALEGDTTEIANLQREDAITKINKISPKNLKMRVAKKSIIACGISIFMAAGILLLPYNVFVFGAEKDLEKPFCSWRFRNLYVWRYGRHSIGRNASGRFFIYPKFRRKVCGFNASVRLFFQYEQQICRILCLARQSKWQQAH